jgi:sugar phosphate isomerase/epimerase
MAMNRRTFLQHSGKAAAALAVSAALDGFASAKQHLKSFGIQLWSVREELKKDFPGTLEKLTSIGYREVEMVWFLPNGGLAPKELRKALDGAGLRATSAHLTVDADFLRTWPEQLDKAHTLGHQYLVVPDLPEETRRTLDDWKKWAERFNQAGEQARKANIWLAFHNEPFAFERIDGKVPYDLFMQWTEPKLVRMQLDTGNMIFAHQDPFAYLAKYKARYGSFHLKDYRNPPAERDRAAGDGVFDFSRFLALVPHPDEKLFYVEFEMPDGEVEAAQKSFTFLKSVTF